MKQETKSKLTYKVVCNLNDMDFYTDNKGDAINVFEQYKEDYGDGIRLYEAETPEEDDEAPEWETIDCYDDDEPKDESKEVKEGGEGFTGGEWELRGNKIFVKGTYNSIATVNIQKAWDSMANPIEDTEANANKLLLVQCKNMYFKLKELLDQFEKVVNPKYTLDEMLIRETKELLRKATPNY